MARKPLPPARPSAPALSGRETPRPEGRGPRPGAKAAAPRGAVQKGGSRSGELWLYGRHPVEAALLNPDRRCRRLMVTREARADLDGVLSRSPHAPTIEPADRNALNDLLGEQAIHQGMALRVDPLPDLTPEDLVERYAEATEAVVLVLDQVTDPHNVGAVLRSAAAFGAVAVMVQDRHSPEETGVLAKSASGALERMPLVRVANLARALETLKEGGFWSAGLAADGPTTLAGAKLSGKVALVLGSEGAGLRRLTRETCDLLVRLPMMPDSMESLNVSNAAAIALYEVRRAALEAAQG
ncbi:23S rRNA (guanosine(2251)-2'-O)-methyltransferase RlmB [Novispirillum itersonii]|uniref:23S rRNA (Guanosine2251-2'-O)-methyltransferase n=1 Tax=Novispirillum itersonii TaxID=189 RepID=A0A7X0DKI0_NOVIT|nr:23S rRNA (guanosine(2251)-2'-O)-methyltransferase RlmB [Novispirillum itersonii]MBB6208966.1 23S rRNA (guanosine2251-2'-O)-methyltransferase [Novispirillum itersonii]